MSKAMKNIITTLIVDEPAGEFSFEQLLDGVKRLTKERIETVKGEILVKPPKARTSFEQTFMRAVSQIAKVIVFLSLLLLLLF